MSTPTRGAARIKPDSLFPALTTPGPGVELGARGVPSPFSQSIAVLHGPPRLSQGNSGTGSEQRLQNPQAHGQLPCEFCRDFSCPTSSACRSRASICNVKNCRRAQTTPTAI
jgi:hypothetical protein